MLTVNNLTKRYGDVLANSKVTFTAEDGQITLMVGPNGAGKSTAIKCIAGLLRFEVNITICGHPNKSVEAKKEFGYIPEMPALFEALTVREGIALEAAIRRHPVQASTEAVSLLANLDEYDAIGGILSYEDLGMYYLEETNARLLALRDYIDYENED